MFFFFVLGLSRDIELKLSLFGRCLFTYIAIQLRTWRPFFLPHSAVLPNVRFIFFFFVSNKIISTNKIDRYCACVRFFFCLVFCGLYIDTANIFLADGFRRRYEIASSSVWFFKAGRVSLTRPASDNPLSRFHRRDTERRNDANVAGLSLFVWFVCYTSPRCELAWVEGDCFARPGANDLTGCSAA